MVGHAVKVLKRALPAPAWERFRARWWRYVRPLLVDYCPIVMPWSTARADNDTARLHRLATSFHWRGERSLVTSVSRGVAIVLWPMRHFLESLRMLREYGPAIKQSQGIGRLRQFAAMMRLGWRSGVPPKLYYRFRLFDARNAARAPKYMFPDEVDYVLYSTLSVNLPSTETLGSKDLFFAHGRKHGLPVAGIVGTLAEGKVLDWFDGASGALPPCDLVLKPIDLACGRGFMRWDFDATTRTWRCGDLQFDAAGLVAYACELAQHHRHIIQRRLHNHPLVAPISGQGLSTIRVVTYRRVDGETGILLACLRMATGASHVDNFEAGGIAAPIDLETGKLGVAAAKDPRRGTFTHHPDTQAPIDGVVLPDLSKALAVALEAHATFPSTPWVGWDVVLTPDGPALLEANPNWCVELAQIVMNTPLGETSYPAIYLEHLAASREKRIPHVGSATEDATGVAAVA